MRNGWLYLRIVAAGLFFYWGLDDGLVMPEVSRHQPWQLFPIFAIPVLTISSFITLLLNGTQVMTPITAKVWRRPSWSCNPFSISQLLLPSHFIAISIVAYGCGQLLGSVKTGSSTALVAVLTLSAGFGMLLGIKLCQLLFAYKFSETGVPGPLPTALIAFSEHAQRQQTPGLTRFIGVVFICFSLLIAAISIAKARMTPSVDYDRVVREGTLVSGRIDSVDQPDNSHGRNKTPAAIHYSYRSGDEWREGRMATMETGLTASMRPGQAVEVYVLGNDSVIKGIKPDQFSLVESLIIFGLCMTAGISAIWDSYRKKVVLPSPQKPK